MKKTLLGTAIIAILIIGACKHDKNMPVPTNDTTQNGGGNGNGNDTSGGGNNGNVDTGICFERDILPIFASNCAQPGCHDAVTRQDGYQFTDYNSITAKNFVAGNAAATELYEKITEDKADKIMPPPPNTPLTTEQKELIRKWIDSGAENSTNCGSKCDSNKFTFTADIKPIIEKNCQGCHSGPSAPLGVKLDTYAGIAAVANNGKLLGTVRHEPGFAKMPQGGNKLSDCEIRQIEKWVDAGAQNN